MCFSVNVNLVKEELEERYGVNFPDKYRYEPSYYYHAFSLPELAAVCSGYPGTIRLLKWGLIPSWVRNSEDAAAIRTKTFNARAESLGSKPSFSPSFKSKRCLIPVKGFFEWQHVGKEKIPWYIYSVNDEILTLAGLYAEWLNKESGELLSTCTIITTDANEMMAEIHNSKKRMPAILLKDDEKKWIDLTTSPEVASEILKPCPVNILKAHTIGPLVNNRNADRNTPEVIREYRRDIKNTLF
ncbi:MAG TPA: SOS response-associated peptidase [Bacteroidales bacterium]|nr:SOS response-associated peptidase [Bacteroidales bacterium]